MRVSDLVECKTFPCIDVRHEAYIVTRVELDPDQIRLLMISEVAPANPADYYYARGDPLFGRTTIQAFQDAGEEISSIQDILRLGIYLTSAVKCGKTGYGIQSATVRECSLLLEKEIDLFPNLQVFMLMGDVAIQAINAIARRAGEARVIPASSTYKIRGQEFFFRGKRVFPSYLQAGPSFFIEKSKRKMIAEDIRSALGLLK
jgi:hypothetical protein